MWSRRFVDLIVDVVLYLMKIIDLKEKNGRTALNQAMTGVISCLAKSLPIPDALNLYEAVDKIFRSCANLREDPTFLIDYSAFLHRE